MHFPVASCSRTRSLAFIIANLQCHLRVHVQSSADHHGTALGRRNCSRLVGVPCVSDASFDLLLYGVDEWGITTMAQRIETFASAGSGLVGLRLGAAFAGRSAVLVCSSELLQCRSVLSTHERKRPPPQPVWLFRTTT